MIFVSEFVLSTLALDDIGSSSRLGDTGSRALLSQEFY